MLVLLLGFGLSAATTFFVIRLARTHVHLSGDTDMSGPQKFHGAPVPRVGGVGIVIGVVGALLLLWAMRYSETPLGLILVACAAPAFLGGLAEDLTKRQSPRRRLFFTAVSAGL
ncbi:MAG TPA: hypothetical protein VGQ93_03800, partial [Lysobacter sp.]|nr:hypothetical protein [Lysobacter sp.]